MSKVQGSKVSREALPKSDTSDKLDETVQPREGVAHEDRAQSVVPAVHSRGSNDDEAPAGDLTSFLEQHT